MNRPRKFERIAILNRGEPAVRFIHAVRDHNRETGDSLKVIAFYTEPDKNSMFAIRADENYYLGPAQFTDENDLDDNGNPKRKSTYLNYEKIRNALIETKAEAVWPGWGFAAEDPRFVEICEEMEIVFIGPSSQVMRDLGDKISSKRIAQEAKSPVIPWNGKVLSNIEEARGAAEELGYPLALKASAGGGGRGIRLLESSEDLEDAFETARSEAIKAFGDGRLFMEKKVPGARHIEVQIAADNYGNVWSVGVRDCSVQRRNQKIIEEAPSPVLTKDQEWEVRKAAERIATEAGYRNLGTAEFLYNPQSESFYFMEMNTRLQVEHPITEETARIDLVKLQIRLALGEKLEGEPPITRGHAIEVRLNAEDPEQGFAPTPGKVISFAIPTGAGIRVDTGIREGDTIPVDFDSMVGKIIAYGETREEARARMDRALSESVIIVDGGSTNKGFLLEVLREEVFKKGEITTAWLDERQGKGSFFEKKHPEAALISAAIEAYEVAFNEAEKKFFKSAGRGRPTLNLPKDQGSTVSLAYEKNSYSFTVCKIAPYCFRLYQGEHQWVDVEYRQTGKYQSTLLFEDEKYQIITARQKNHYYVEVEGVNYRIDRDTGGKVLSPMPAIVLAIHVKEGEEIEADQKIATLEAMKMEMPIFAPHAGVVKNIQVSPNTQVGAGDTVLFIEEQEEEKEGEEGEDLTFPFVSEVKYNESVEGCLHLMGELKRLFLGFNEKEDYIDRVMTQLLEGSQKFLDAPSSPVLEALKELLEIYIATESLFHQRYLGPDSQESNLSPKTHLYMYLNWFRREGEGLPNHFIQLLEEALAYYQVSTLKPTKDLQNSIIWLFNSHQNVKLKNKVIIEILRFFLQAPSWISRTRSRDFRKLINKITEIAQGQYSNLYNLGRQVLYALFDSRRLERRRKKILAKVDDMLDNLEGASSDAERATHIAWLVNVAPSLVAYLAEKVEEKNSLRSAILETIARRLYRHYHLRDLYSVGSKEKAQCVATIEEGGDTAEVIVHHEVYSQLKEALEQVKALGEQLEKERVVADIILLRQEKQSREEEEAYIHSTLADFGAIPGLERICLLVTSAEEPVHNYTFKKFSPSESWQEIEFLRDIHPSVNRRLELWRFGEFDMERLPSKEDVYLFKGQSKTNEKDERLFAIAEIRDLAPIRRKRHIFQLPHMEHILLEAFEAIREELAKRENNRTLNWNRVIIYVWPPVLITKEEIETLARRLWPLTEGLELEKAVFRAKLREHSSEIPRDTVIQIRQAGQEIAIVYKEPDNSQIKPMSNYARKVLWAKQRGMIYPYELIKMLTPPATSSSEFPEGSFEEYDIEEAEDGEPKAVPVERAYGLNEANVVFGVVTNYTDKFPEGIQRVLIIGDSTQAMGSLAEAECVRIMAALDLARQMKLPVEWYPISSGAMISMDSGTENLDWTARVLRHIVEFTQDGGMINIIVDGINVGAQSYFNAEATMLMHTKGCLIMTPKGAMVLTGKQALDYSGGVSAEDNIGIGGFERIMGPNGQAQYYAKNLVEAYQILFKFYECTYIAPGESLPRPRKTKDPRDRNICEYPYKDDLDVGFETIGDILGEEKNAGRKKPFSIRKILLALKDQEANYLERWKAMKEAEITVVMDTHIGGYPSSLIGIESKPISRYGYVPSDGPEVWTGGTLFPKSSKKLARAINSADENRPIVILANLSGFDGSPESLRKLQLEYGAEIGRAVVNYRGPLVLFSIIARYHGGAYVVFSKALNPRLGAVSLEGSYASVIGGAPAAAVVFPRQVRSLTLKDERVIEMRRELNAASPQKKPLLQQKYNEVYQKVYNEKLGEVAAEFDSIHTVERAKSVGSLDEILPPSRLRPFVIDEIEKAYRLYSSRREGKDGTGSLGDQL